MFYPFIFKTSLFSAILKMNIGINPPLNCIVQNFSVAVYIYFTTFPQLSVANTQRTEICTDNPVFAIKKPSALYLSTNGIKLFFCLKLCL